jgi:hypothetical protein
MGGALDELSSLASTVVGASMAEQGQLPPAPTFQESLSTFLGSCLDQTAASVTLINGRLPLDCSEEALGKVARCAARFLSYHCVCLRCCAAAVHRQKMDVLQRA